MGEVWMKITPQVEVVPLSVFNFCHNKPILSLNKIKLQFGSDALQLTHPRSDLTVLYTHPR